jgi:hypothetical protein
MLVGVLHTRESDTSSFLVFQNKFLVSQKHSVTATSNCQTRWVSNGSCRTDPRPPVTMAPSRAPSLALTLPLGTGHIKAAERCVSHEKGCHSHPHRTPGPNVERYRDVLYCTRALPHSVLPHCPLNPRHARTPYSPWVSAPPPRPEWAQIHVL